MEPNATTLLNDHGLTAHLDPSELQALDLEHAPRTRVLIAGDSTTKGPGDPAASGGGERGPGDPAASGGGERGPGDPAASGGGERGPGDPAASGGGERGPGDPTASGQR